MFSPPKARKKIAFYFLIFLTEVRKHANMNLKKKSHISKLCKRQGWVFAPELLRIIERNVLVKRFALLSTEIFGDVLWLNV